MKDLAIVGTGIAGMGCAHLLKEKYRIQLFEKNNYVGGHTNTISVKEGARTVYMDTGFMVFNFVTYPHLTKLFEQIGAPIKKTSMSFSVQHVPTGLEYCGSGLKGLFAQRRNLVNPSYIRMLFDIARFNKLAVKVLDDERYANFSLADFMKAFGFGEDMLWKYLIPMSSAVWSTPMEKMLDFPVITLIRFFHNHGFLGLNTQHQWYTLENGSQAYREKLIAPFKDTIHVNKPVVKVVREGEKVALVFADGTQTFFDKVILACHANEALSLLEHPLPLERSLLSRFHYQNNLAVVHTDERVMPRTKKTWSSWNYRIETINGKRLPSTIYWMNSLQGVSDTTNYFVSINPIVEQLDPSKIIRSIVYEHPLFDLPAIEAQKELHRLNERGPLYFCGSYFKYGFHEDAYKSAVDLCAVI